MKLLLSCNKDLGNQKTCKNDILVNKVFFATNIPNWERYDDNQEAS